MRLHPTYAKCHSYITFKIPGFLILQDQDALRESLKTDVAVLHSKEQVGSMTLQLTWYKL